MCLKWESAVLISSDIRMCDGVAGSRMELEHKNQLHNSPILDNRLSFLFLNPDSKVLASQKVELADHFPSGWFDTASQLASASPMKFKSRELFWKPRLTYSHPQI